ncbi:MAG: T9SS type A sorting domain-containing protein [Bacteroidia bacterium]
MKILKQKLKRIWVLGMSTLLSAQLFAQQNWAAPPFNINMNGSTPSWSTISNAGTGSYYVSNGGYDSYGHLLFYLRNEKLYAPGNTTSFGTLPYPSTGNSNSSPYPNYGPEIEVVPVPGSELCKKFYVIYTTLDGGQNGLSYVTVDCSGSSPTMSAATILEANYTDASGLAVSKKFGPNDNRYLFTLGFYQNAIPGEHHVLRYTISSTGIGSQYEVVDLSSTFYSSFWGSNFVGQLTLSPDQAHLAWAASSGGTYQSVYEINLSNYIYGGTLHQYSLPTTSSWYTSGVQYNASSTQLFASTKEGIYWMNVGGTPTLITGSASYTSGAGSAAAGSQLQLMNSTGYVVGAQVTTSSTTSGKLYYINTSTHTLASFSSSPKLVSDAGVFQVGTGYATLYTLPDGIDGETSFYPSLSASVSSPSPVCSGTGVTATPFYSGSTPDSYQWQLQSCNSSGVPDGVYSYSTSWTTGAPSAYTFPGSASLTCNKNYLITLSVQNVSACIPTQSATALIYIACNPVPVITGNLNLCSGSSTQLCQNYTPSSQYSVMWSPGKKLITQCITVSPTANTTYNVTVTDNTTGCSGTASATVKVATNIPSFNFGDYTTNSSYASIYAWANNSATTGNPGYGYVYIVEELNSAQTAVVWTENNNPCYWWNFPSQELFYNIDNSVTDYNSSWTGLPTACNGYAPGSATNPYPAGKFKYGNPYRVTLGSWIINTADNSTICPWTQASQIIIPNYTGGLRANSGSGSVITEDHSAPDFSYLRFQKQGAVSEKIKNDNNAVLTVYPNPSHGNFTVETSVSVSQLLQIFDINGNNVISQVINGNTEINCDNLPAGIYNVKITNGDNTTNRRVVISK